MQKTKINQIYLGAMLLPAMANVSSAGIIAGYDFSTNANATQTIAGASATAFQGGVGGFNIETTGLLLNAIGEPHEVSESEALQWLYAG